jgi:cation diffusion facilitator CzcD-associated flavoprotein CzcO
MFYAIINYSGEKLHSWQYKTPHGLEDKIVLIIGIGSSAGDMAVELGRAAKQVLIMIFSFSL